MLPSEAPLPHPILLPGREEALMERQMSIEGRLRLDRKDQAEYNCPVGIESDGRREFFEIYSKSYSRCFGPEPNCRKKIIRAHSIPNARELEALQEDGHVLTVQLRFGEEGP